MGNMSNAIALPTGMLSTWGTGGGWNTTSENVTQCLQCNCLHAQVADAVALEHCRGSGGAQAAVKMLMAPIIG